MKYYRIKTMIVMVLVLLVISVFVVQAQTPQETLNQYISNLQNNPNDNILREKIIKFVQGMKTKPAIPEEAERRMYRGMTAMKSATNYEEFQDAAKEFDQASIAAPWYANAYYNAGIAHNKASNYGEAVRNLRLYLLAAPNTKDTEQAKALLYDSEYQNEKKSKALAKQQADEARKAQGKKALEFFRGEWHGKYCSDKKTRVLIGCNEKQYQESNWHTFNEDDGPAVLNFKFPGDGTVINYASWAWCLGEGGEVHGIPQGSDPSDIRWEEWPKKGPPRQVWSRMGNASVTVSCDRPTSDDAYDPNAIYHYVEWFRP